jgi:hypothetical protein
VSRAYVDAAWDMAIAERRIPWPVRGTCLIGWFEEKSPPMTGIGMMTCCHGRRAEEGHDLCADCEQGRCDHRGGLLESVMMTAGGEEVRLPTIADLVSQAIPMKDWPRHGPYVRVPVGFHDYGAEHAQNLGIGRPSPAETTSWAHARSKQGLQDGDPT